MINFYDIIKEETKEHNTNRSKIPDHHCRILIIGGSGFGKANSLFNLTNGEPDIDKIYLYAKDPSEAKYQFFMEQKIKYRIDDLKIQKKAFLEYSNDMDGIYKDIE